MNHGISQQFPLYKAPISLVNAPCTICSVVKPTCLGVEFLIAPCPSCDRPRPWEVACANEITRCPWCERQAEWPKAWPWERDDIRVCVDCLRTGRAAISHSTDLGYLSPPWAMQGMLYGGSWNLSKANELKIKTSVLETFDDGSQSLGLHLPKELLDDLMRTPRHPTLQEEHWTYHCGGWMTYTGKWEIQDFERHAPGKVYEWFAEHFNDPEDAEMYWDWIKKQMGWSCVFVCQRCGKYKVFYDVT